MTSPVKIALVPGASRPIGRAIARALAHNGYILYLPYFDWPESIAEMKDEFHNAGHTFFCEHLDLRNQQQVQNYVEKISSKFGKLDVLINNIERGGMPIVHGSYEHPHNKDQWQREIDTTLNAKVHLFTACFALLLNSPQASVINITSIAGECARSGPAALFFSDGYSSANAAVSPLTATWARQGAPHIRVNELALGFIDSRHGKGTRGWQELREQDKQNLHDHILLGRTGTPQEVADTVEFLCEKASYITGTRIKMDGGYCLGGEPVPALPPGIM